MNKEKIQKMMATIGFGLLFASLLLLLTFGTLEVFTSRAFDFDVFLQIAIVGFWGSAFKAGAVILEAI